MDPGALGALIPIVAMVIVGFVVVSRSDIGRAMAHRIAGGAAVSPEFETELRALRGELDALRGELIEAQERIDFTERILAGVKKEG